MLKHLGTPSAETLGLSKCRDTWGAQMSEHSDTKCFRHLVAMPEKKRKLLALMPLGGCAGWGGSLALEMELCMFKSACRAILLMSRKPPAPGRKGAHSREALPTSLLFPPPPRGGGKSKDDPAPR